MSFNLKAIFGSAPVDITSGAAVTMREYFDDTVRRVSAINREKMQISYGTDQHLLTPHDVASALLLRAKEKFRIERENPDPGRIEPIKPAQALIDRCDDLRETYGLPIAQVAYVRGDTRRIMAAYGIHVVFPMPVTSALDGVYEKAAQRQLPPSPPARLEQGPTDLREYFVKTIDHIATALLEDPGMDDRDGDAHDISPSRLARQMLDEAEALSAETSISQEAALAQVCDRHRFEAGLLADKEVCYLEGDLSRAQEKKAREYQPGITLMY